MTVDRNCMFSWGLTMPSMFASLLPSIPVGDYRHCEIELAPCCIKQPGAWQHVGYVMTFAYSGICNPATETYFVLRLTRIGQCRMLQSVHQTFVSVPILHPQEPLPDSTVAGYKSCAALYAHPHMQHVCTTLHCDMCLWGETDTG
jgi:hypothetical protein